MDSLLKNLNEPQKEAVSQFDGPVLILAGAGSGKTRVITHRIAAMLNAGINPWNILAVTFTNKAAEEMKKRVEAISHGKSADVFISTYHSLCAKFLRVEASQTGLNRHFVIYDGIDQKNVIKECIKDLGYDEKKFRPGMIMELISRAKDELLDAASYEIHSRASNDSFREMISAVYKLYEQKLKAFNALDFGDLIMKSVEALRDNQFIREKYQERFKYILIDEYQDTNHAQYMLTKYFAAKHKNICVVGDEDQAIYMWRGADIRNILEFESDYKNVKMIKLEQNYRSTKRILTASMNVVRNNASRKEKELWTDKNEGEEITVSELSSEIEEARFVACEIKRLLETGSSLRDFAVFYRTNAQSRVLEDALRRAEIPYKVFGSVRFYDRAEVKDILSYLRAAVNPADSLSIKRIVNKPVRGIGKTSVEAVETYAKNANITFYEALSELKNIDSLQNRLKAGLLEFKNLMDELTSQQNSMGVKDMIKLVIEKTQFIKLLEDEESVEADMRIGNIKELVNAAEEFGQISGDESVSSFLEQISLVSDMDQYDAEKGFVSLLTIHLAKGLEFPVVFITGMEEGLFPIGESFFERDELEEERRLCYVGMTRAKEKLYMLSAASRKLYGQNKWNLPSRFIAETKIDVAAAMPEPYAEDYSGFTESVYKVGMKVMHHEFGRGKIVEKSGSDDNLKLLVFFENGQKKKLVVKYAKLEVCS